MELRHSGGDRPHGGEVHHAVPSRARGGAASGRDRGRGGRGGAGALVRARRVDPPSFRSDPAGAGRLHLLLLRGFCAAVHGWTAARAQPEDVGVPDGRGTVRGHAGADDRFGRRVGGGRTLAPSRDRAPGRRAVALGGRREGRCEGAGEGHGVRPHRGRRRAVDAPFDGKQEPHVPRRGDCAYGGAGTGGPAAACRARRRREGSADDARTGGGGNRPPACARSAVGDGKGIYAAHDREGRAAHVRRAARRLRARGAVVRPGGTRPHLRGNDLREPSAPLPLPAARERRARLRRGRSLHGHQPARRVAVVRQGRRVRHLPRGDALAGRRKKEGRRAGPLPLRPRVAQVRFRRGRAGDRRQAVPSAGRTRHVRRPGRRRRGRPPLGAPERGARRDVRLQ